MAYFKHKQTGQIITPKQLPTIEGCRDAVFDCLGEPISQAKLEQTGWLRYEGEPTYKGMPISIEDIPTDGWEVDDE